MASILRKERKNKEKEREKERDKGLLLEHKRQSLTNNNFANRFS